MDDNELVMLQDDAGKNRMKMIALINRNVHLYVMHPVLGEEKILPIKNNVGPIGVEDDKLEDDMLDELNKCYCNKFDEGGPAGVEDSDAVNQKGSLEEVNIDGATENINQKDSCLNVNFEGEAVSEDAIVNITLDGTTEHVVCDQDDILDDTDYLVSVQTDSVAEGLICNQEDEITIDIARGKEKGRGKGNLKGKGNGKGKGKSKVAIPRKQKLMEEEVVGSGVFDDVNECEATKESFRGLSDIEEYDTDDLQHDYDSEDSEVLKDDFPTFKLPK
ncbi:unnamed protein product [Vicia faba]|uniref:Uncharacterized protein n=1 Tax=Vicia faba TaxID=3906 RepID=A0AAV0YJ10_VICFA|nr:unnamed protein product [Vicia faba]